MSTLSTVVVNGQADDYAARFDGGTLKCYTGSPPASPQAAATGTLIVTITLANPAFGSAAAGVVTMNATPGAVAAVAAGTVGWGRFLTSGAAALEDVTIGVAGSGADLITTKAAPAVDDEVDIVSFTHTVPAA
jgi:hypothetical protein